MHMRLYKVVLLINLALGVGFLCGSVWWGREVKRLRLEVSALRRSANADTPAQGGWSARGIVRVVAPEINRIFIDHGAIPGLMEAMTMAFEPEDAKLLNGLTPGDEVLFTLRQQGGRLILVAIAKTQAP
jgi:Cu/Ag efflux protein CusF